ncbi:LuxR C-terminal-related transcriptional regulator [Streptomyces sp. NPDC005227]|uniref:LuxR C-terminal-related transcriptional regulator n=1 Tax=Streptomyces sp. NPDC005227 TaxID=3364707 RepID=UPI0036CA1C4D
MIAIKNLREHILTAAEKYDFPLSLRQAETLSNHLAVHVNRGTATAGAPRLTDVQFGALVGLASGEDAATTGRRLGRSENTIKTHRRTLYAALGAHSGAQAVAIAIDLGLLHTAKQQPVGGDAR